MPRRLILLIAALSMAWAIVVAMTGGFVLRAGPLRAGSRSALLPAAVAAVALVALVARRDRRALAGDVAAAGRVLATVSPLVACGAAAATLAVGIHWGTWVAGGSDSYCYVEQASLWATGQVLQPQQVGFTPPWPEAALSLTPTGFVPSRTVPGGLSPICPVGLSLGMAIPRRLFGRDAVFYVVPVLGALGVWWTWRVARALAGPAAGAASAVLLATSPIFLYQVVQPMSDVPAAALWTGAVAAVSRARARGALAAGLLAAGAMAIRPNLAPLALPLLVFVWMDTPRAAMERTKVRATRALAFVAGVVPGVAATAMAQHLLYGSALRSGYGGLDQLFRLEHVWPNLARYPRWLLETQTPFVLLAFIAPLVVGRWTAPSESRPRQAVRPGAVADIERARSAAPLREHVRDGARATRIAWLCLAIAVMTAVAYLPYVPFDGWWFLRFWLPAIPMLVACAVAAVVSILERRSEASRVIALALLTVGLAAWQVHTAATRSAFALQRLEARFAEAGQYVAAHLPPGAVVLTVWHSGSVRYYGDRVSVLWDTIEPAWLDRAVAFLSGNGRRPYLLLETWEEERFRARFAGRSALGTLDWPPMAQIGRDVRVYDPADRARFGAGESVRTERVWTRAER